MNNTMKHKPRNNKRNTPAARLISTEYVALSEEGKIKADYDKEDELIEYLKNNPNCLGYKLLTYSYNKQIIKTKERKG